MAGTKQPLSLTYFQRVFAGIFAGTPESSEQKSSMRMLERLKPSVLKSLAVAVFVLAGLTSCAEVPFSYKPDDGYVPDAKTARKIAEAVWEPIYGKKDPGMGKPYTVTLKNGVWTVEGLDTDPPGMSGGTAIIEISKQDGRILRVSHGM